MYNSLPHLTEWSREAAHMLNHVIKRDQQADEREARTERWVVRSDRREPEQHQRHADVEVVRREGIPVRLLLGVEDLTHHWLPPSRSPRPCPAGDDTGASPAQAARTRGTASARSRPGTWPPAKRDDYHASVCALPDSAAPTALMPVIARREFTLTSARSPKGVPAARDLRLRPRRRRHRRCR